MDGKYPKKLDAAIMVAMRMADDVLDIGRIETHSLQAVHYFVLCGVTVKRIDENDPRKSSLPTRCSTFVVSM